MSAAREAAYDRLYDGCARVVGAVERTRGAMARRALLDALIARMLRAGEVGILVAFTRLALAIERDGGAPDGGAPDGGARDGGARDGTAPGSIKPGGGDA